MEKHSMLMVKKNQYRENSHTTQRNLKIQCYPHQATIDLLHRIGKNHLKLHIEPKKSLHSQAILSKKNKSEVSMLPDFKLYYRAIVMKTAQ